MGSSLVALSLTALIVAGCAGMSPQPPPGDPRERAALEAFAIDPDAPHETLTALFAGDLDRFSEADLRELLDALPARGDVRVTELVEGPTDQTFYVEVEEVADGEAVAGYSVELAAVLHPEGTTWRVQSLYGPGVGWPRRRRPRESLSVSPIEQP